MESTLWCELIFDEDCLGRVLAAATLPRSYLEMFTKSQSLVRVLCLDKPYAAGGKNDLGCRRHALLARLRCKILEGRSLDVRGEILDNSALRPEGY